MKQLNTFWQSLQKSLLDFAYYRDIAKASYWFSFKYLLFLLVCLSFVRSVQLGVSYSRERKNIPPYIAVAQKEIAAFYPKELELRISNGKLYTNVQEPYTIEFPKVFGDVEGKHFVVIDTKGVADNYPEYNTVILATRQALVFPAKQQGSKTTTQLYYFSEIKQHIYVDHFVYTKIIQGWNPLISKLPRLIDGIVIAGLFLLPFVGGFLWLLGTLFVLLFLTLPIWVVGKIVKCSYGYKTLFRLGMHGATWAILFSFLLDITGQEVSYLYNLVFVAWMTFVVIKMRDPKIAA